MREALLPGTIDENTRATLESAGGSGASDEEALGGPGRECLDIDDIFSRSFGDPFEDLVVDLAAQSDLPQEDVRKALHIDPRTLPGNCLASTENDEGGAHYELRGIGSDIIAVRVEGNSASLAGFYHGCQLTVLEPYQGRGLGTALAAWKFIFYGGFPCWDLDEASYSPRGMGVHRAAFDALTALL